MKKQIVKKIIGGIAVFIFAMFFIQAILPSQISAEAPLNYENPNANGKNPYKFKLTDTLNSQLIMQVVGCTGVVDKVSKAVTGFISGQSKELTQEAKAAIVSKVCGISKGAAEGATAATDAGGFNFTNALKDIIKCNEIQKTNDPKLLAAAYDTAKKEDATKRREECLNGIAITLAKNQLTSMTRYTMNWVNSGFSGDPMYVRNITNFTNSLERNVLETGVNKLIDPNNAYPYGRYFSQSVVRGYNAKTGIDRFANSLVSDLSSFVTDPNSYYSSQDDNKTALQLAQEANNRFSNDFSTGGWDAFTALENDRNNIFGFTMNAQDELANQAATDIQNTKDELLTNNGFLSQKKCVKWQVLNKDGTPKNDFGLSTTSYDINGKLIKGVPVPIYVTTAPTDGNGECVEYETVTPGSLIQDKVSTYLNSAERQLELADTINEALNSLFTALISRFQNQGLASLSSGTYTYSRSDLGIGGGLGSNSTAGMDNSLFGSSSLSSGSSKYSNGSFDLTRDLGNTFIHSYDKISKGNWDASKNIPRLTVGLGPYIDGKYPSNVFYEVTKAGDTKLFNDGSSAWAVGDRAFWNGTEWQNWKCGKLNPQGPCTVQANPLDKRGIIQIQKDYIVAAKETLTVLPGIMPKIGELDYCIPGPNPNWQSNSSDTYSAFTDYAYTLSSTYNPGSWFMVRDASTFSLAEPGDPAYDNYEKIFHFWERSTPTIIKEIISPYWNKIWKKPSPGYNGKDVPNSLFIQDTMPWRGLNELVGKEMKNANAQQVMTAYQEQLLTTITKDLTKFYEEYAKIINGDKQILGTNGNPLVNSYGTKSLMQQPYLENEKTPSLDENPAYLPMAADGLNITKDILTYNNDIATVTDGYNSNIAQANTNVYNLNIIKTQVNEIIKAAQNRRDAKLLAKLNGDGNPALVDENGNSGPQPARLTLAQYLEKYKTCFDEENIIYFDDSDITKNTGNEATRCFDGLDNDRDGLVDAKDPDCKDAESTSLSCNDKIDNDGDGLVDANDPDCKPGGSGEENNNNIEAKSCLVDADSFRTVGVDSNRDNEKKCGDYISANECNGEKEYQQGGLEWDCVWK